MNIVHLDDAYDNNIDYLIGIKKYENSINDNFLYLKKYIEDIKNLNIKNFNILLFKSEIRNLSDEDFDNEIYNYLVDEIFEPNIFDFSIYLSLNQEGVFTKEDLIEFIDFYMWQLPYVYLPDILKNFETLPEFYAYLMQDNTNIKNDLKNNILKNIDTNKKFENLVSGLGGNISSQKNKVKYDNMLSLLNININIKEKRQMKFIELIDDVQLDDLRNLITKYIENDSENLKS